MRGDGLAFAVRVRRQKDEVGSGGKLLELGDNFFFAGDDDVIGLEVVRRIYTESALG